MFAKEDFVYIFFYFYYFFLTLVLKQNKKEKKKKEKEKEKLTIRRARLGVVMNVSDPASQLPDSRFDILKWFA